RKDIDHPQYVPEESRHLMDFRAGDDKGRIYRVVADDPNKGQIKPVDLGGVDVEALVETLEHPNAWWRETAQRLLVERKEQSAVPHLRKMLDGGKTPQARYHSLWTLEILGALSNADLLKALSDEHPGVRENAIRIAESRIKDSFELLDPLLKLANDPSPRVRFQLALALGESPTENVVEALASIARRDGQHLWTRMAVLTSIGEHMAEFLEAFVAQPAASVEVQAAMMQDLGRLFGRGQSPERCLDLLLEITDPSNEFSWQPAALVGIAEGLLSNENFPRGDSPLLTLVDRSGEDARRAAQRLEGAFDQALNTALDDTEKQDLRTDSISLLGYGKLSQVGEALTALLEPRHPSEIGVAAARALGNIPDRKAGEILVDSNRWQTYTPQVRNTVLSVVMSQPLHLEALLDAIENENIAPSALSPSRRNQLMRHRDQKIQERAKKLFADMESGDRMKVYEEYRDTLPDLSGDITRGKEVFASQCATCHSFQGMGGAIGPDLS